MNAESIQQRIQIARRDAEALKDRIKRKKDELADTTRKCQTRWRSSQFLLSGSESTMKLIVGQSATSPDNESTSSRD